MSERIRVLSGILSLGGGDFTVFDLADKTGVNVSTVRTVLSRDHHFVREVGRSEPSSRGGRTIRYVLEDSRQTMLEEELAFFRAESRELNGEAEVIRPPVTLVAAEDILLRQYDETVGKRAKTELLTSALLHLAATAKVLEDMDAGGEGPKDDLRNLKVQRMGLHAYATDLLRNLSKQSEMAPSAQSPSPEPNQLSQIDALELFERSRDIARANLGPDTADSSYPPEALMAAALYFGEHVGDTCESSVTADHVANGIRDDLYSKFPMDALIVLGREPASYQVGAVRPDNAKNEVMIWSRAFDDARKSLASFITTPHHFPVQTSLATVNG